MNTANIISLVISGLTGLASIATCLACYFTYKTTRPNIKIKLDNTNANWVHIHKNQYDINFAVLFFTIRNLSMISGTIDTFYISYKGKNFYAETIDMIYDIGTTTFTMDMGSDRIPIKAENKRLKLPLKIDGLSFIHGFILFPNFIPIGSSPVKISVFVRKPNHKFKRCVARNLCIIEKPATIDEDIEDKHDIA